MFPKPTSLNARSLGAAFLLLSMIASIAGAATTNPAAPLSFNRDIRPLLSENCFACHGPDAHKRKAELRLDVREAALEALAFVPGKPDESEAIRRIFATDPDDRMPPADSHRTLTDVQKDLLKRWVAEGARYELHWAYVVPVRPAVPVVRDKATGGKGDKESASSPSPANPIDAFILQRLAQENLAPSPAADRRTLIRRLSFDLTGLPPEPQDVEEFVASRDPQAYEKLVRRFLASPHFGERLAIPWLDLVRFADTTGFHNDVELRVWPFRDYVINAFNQNLPFDQFTREQLAGDLLPNSTITQRIASGYNRIHRMSAEGGIQDKEYFAKYSADRVRTTATVWLGSTLACAECHDHKFDPFTAKDFYRFAAIFSDLQEKGAYNLSGGFTRENLTEETIFETPEQKQRLDALAFQITRLAVEMNNICDEDLAAGRTAWEASILQAVEAGSLAWRVQRPFSAESLAGAQLTIDAESNSIIPGGRNPPNDTYVVTIPAPFERITGVRLESVPDERFSGDEVARAGHAFFISEIEVFESREGGPARERRDDSRPGAQTIPPLTRRATLGEPIRIAESRSNADEQDGYAPAFATDGDPATTVSFFRKKGATLALRFAEPWSGGPDAKLTVRIRHSERHPYQNLGRFKLALHTEPKPDAHPNSVPEPVLRALKMAPEKRTPAQRRELTAYYRSVAPELAPLRAKHTAAVNARDRMIAELPSMPVSKSVKPRPIRVLPRGDWMNESGELVEPGVPAFMRQIEPRDGQRVSRLDFAEWLVSPENPLTARAFVNRLWRLYFGIGLSRTLEDLGSQGEWPTHPELLDWLAVEFRESGWNVKHMIELIVTSRTYQQSSAPRPDLDERDPQNRLLARQSRFRLDAELVRDNALAVSGLLVRQLGGPSAKPYQPSDYYMPLNFPRREYAPDVGVGLYRRGVYTHWQRTFLLPSFIAFDAPARDECTANRDTSNTPLQALVLLNDPSYVEAARVLAEKMLRNGGKTPQAKIAWAFARAVARPPTSPEVRALQQLLEQQRARYRADEPAARELIAVGEAPVAPDLPAAELAAWTSVARAILNLHETITRM